MKRADSNLTNNIKEVWLACFPNENKRFIDYFFNSVFIPENMENSRKSDNHEKGREFSAADFQQWRQFRPRSSHDRPEYLTTNEPAKTATV